MKWYETNYASHRDWVFDNMENLGLSTDEVMVALLIDFCNEKRLKISIEGLAKKMNCDFERVNAILNSLCAKAYLTIKASGKGIRYDLSGLFEVNVEQRVRIQEGSLFDLFESEFKRPLSRKEMEQVNEWLKVWDKKSVVHALKEASMYEKVSMAYIYKILINKDEGKK